MSLARQSFQRKTAAAVAATTEPGAPVHANAYELQLIALADAKRALKQVQSVERKAEVKRRVLPQFMPWVEGVLAEGRGGQDDVLMTVLVWQIDVGNYPAALDITHYALQHGLILPDQYRRDVATLVAEEMAEQALQALGAGQPFDLASLQRAADLTAEHDMPDEVRAKLCKALGLGLRNAADLDSKAPNMDAAATALTFLRRALELHARAGVKKDIERLERMLKA